MRIFVFESLSAGPLEAAASETPCDSLLREGRAMLDALAGDLAAVSGIEVQTLLDVPRDESAAASDRLAAFDRLAADCDATIVIAPEIGGELTRWRRRVRAVGRRSLGPSIEAVELLSDKHRTAELLRSRGVPACRGVRIKPGPIDRAAMVGLSFPAVVKPIDGAGSLGVRLLRSAEELSPSGIPRRLEAFAPGIAASVAVLCGPHGRCVLPACSQRLTDDGQFRYLGGSTPLALPLDLRARALAERAVAAITGLSGYVGVDLVLGDDPAGADDMVIEINPRLTTSYVGLRRLATSNLAAAMLDIAAGRSVSALRFHDGKVEFDSDGATRYTTSNAAAAR